MLLKTVRGFLGVACLALMSTLLVSSNAVAQGGDPYEGNVQLDPSYTAPHGLTLVIGGGVTYNFANTRAQGYFPPNPNSTPPGDVSYAAYAKGNYITPSFHLGLEIPVADAFMIEPRITYRDLSSVLDNSTIRQNPQRSYVGYAYKTIGLDLLGKITMGNFHVLVGPYLGESIKRSYTVGASTVEAATTSTTVMPGVPEMFFSVGAGFGYDIPLAKTNDLWLTPEFTYNYPITNLGGSAGDLIVQQIKGAVSLKFDLSGNNDMPAPPPAMAISARVTAKGVLPDGSVVAEPAVPSEAQHTRASTPFLPYIFFDAGDANIPARYSRTGATGGFTAETLAGKDAVDVNHAALDIIGMRLKNNPSANLMLTGTNMNTGVEKGKTNLSRDRAAAVRDYLVSTWGISSTRISTDARDLPEIPTNPTTKAGQEENRRVEVASNDKSIIEPVKIETRNNSAVGDTKVRLETTVTPAGTSFQNWTLSIDQNGTPVASKNGTGSVPSVETFTIPDASRFLNEAVHYQLTATDMKGNLVKADGMTRIVPRTVDRENLERYAMLSFNFDQANITDRAKMMLDLIAESIRKDATGLRIDGYCDSTGTDEYNQALSEARANSAVTALRSMTQVPANTAVVGHGEQNPKFNNDLPEGRQLNRRVEFTIDKSSR